LLPIDFIKSILKCEWSRFGLGWIDWRKFVPFSRQSDARNRAGRQKKFNFLFFKLTIRSDAWMVGTPMEGMFFSLSQGTRSMSIESMNSIIAVAFVAVWIMAGQFSLVKH